MLPPQLLYMHHWYHSCDHAFRTHSLQHRICIALSSDSHIQEMPPYPTHPPTHPGNWVCITAPSKLASQ